MRIRDVVLESSVGRATLGARLTWEDLDLPEYQVWYETETERANGYRLNPAALVVGTFLRAMCLRERRLLFEGTLSPRLREGLSTAMLHFCRWYGFRPIAIEASDRCDPGFPPPIPRTASFLSGGVDSLATLAINRRDYPAAHPASIRTVLFVKGLEGKANAALVERTLQRFAAEAGLELLSVSTNLIGLDRRQPYQTKIYAGSFFASAAHLFSGRLTTAIISSSHHVLELEPWGTHPLVDPSYSSDELAIRHEGGTLWRHEKVALVAGWDEALRVLRPCWNPDVPADALNCGRCEKCLRTMCALLACGKREDCPVFPTEVTRTLISDLRVQPLHYDGADRDHWMREVCLTLSLDSLRHWEPLLEPLRSKGRRDLAVAIQAKLRDVELAQSRRGARLRRMLRRVRSVAGQRLGKSAAAAARAKSLERLA